MKLSKRFKNEIINLIFFITGIVLCISIISVPLFDWAKNNFNSTENENTNIHNVEYIDEKDKYEADTDEDDEQKIINKTDESPQAKIEQSEEVKIEQPEEVKTDQQESVAVKNKDGTKDTRKDDNTKIEIITTSYTQGKEISESQAKKLAIDQFENLGDKVTEYDLKIYTINRDGIMSFYIVSKKNTVEINKSDGKITRINNRTLDELRRDKLIN